MRKILGLLLAISPLLIFYSRICRPYSAVALLAFTALLLATRWMQAGGFRPALFFIITGVLAIYFHLFAMVTVAAPMLAAFVFHVWKHFRKIPRADIERRISIWTKLEARSSSSCATGVKK